MFFGRQDLIDQLSALFRKRVASLVTCRGRRRIGKSTLVEKFAEKERCRFIKIEGKRPAPGLTDVDELATFARQLADQTGAERGTPADWPDAFRRLDGRIGDREKTVVLLDEVSWLAHYADGFADDFKIAWDNLFKKHDRLVLVLCGSVSSWIRENIIDNSAFFGRRSLDIIVPELPLADCAKFWGPAASRIAPREILDVLSVTGGVPRYLEEIDPGLSAFENIRRLCFCPNALLRTDFGEMFRDVVTRERDFSGSVLKCLSDGPRTAAEIEASLGIGKGGRVTAVLERLSEAGLSAGDEVTDPETGRRPKERRWRLRDNYSRFFLKYIEPSAGAIDSGAFEITGLDTLEGIDSIFGLAFENLVINHVRDLLPLLNLRGALVLSAAPYQRRGTSGARGRAGVQIDLLLQTRRTVCVVEVKRKGEIGREIIDETDAKLKALKLPAGVSTRAALVYEGHLAPVVEADGYFDSIVPFHRLLGL